MSGTIKKCIILLCLAVALAVILIACGGSGGGGKEKTPQITVADSVAPQNDLLVPFGTVTIGYSTTGAVAIGNSGTADLVIGNIAAGDALGAPFSITSDKCTGRTLAPGTSCELIISFAPGAAVLSTDSFDIPSNDPHTPSITVNVSGTGTTAPPAPRIVVTDSVIPANDQLIYFGDVNLGGVATQAVTVTNGGTANLTIGQIGQAYPLIGPFAATGCSGQTLAPSQSCVVTVEFHPNSAGLFSGGFDIPSNDAGGSVGVGVGGTGVDMISSSLISFGTVTINQTLAQDLTISNSTGTTDVLIGQIANLDPLNAPFSILADGCSNKTVSPGASCTVTVEFAPTAGGSYSDSFDIPASGAVSGDFKVAVSGTSGAGTVSGVITLPASATGTCYAVVLSASLQLANLMNNAVAVVTGQTDGSTSIAYTLPDVAPGQYYLYAGVDNDASSASPPGCTFGNGTPTHGDFVGFYGGGIPSSPNVTVNAGVNTFDFSLSIY